MARKGLTLNVFPSAKTLSSSPSFPSPSLPSTPSRTFSESMMEENIENAELIITKWDLNSSSLTQVTPLFHHDRREAKEFLKSVIGLHRAMHFLVSHHPDSAKLMLAQNLMQLAMKRLEKEFYHILSANHYQLDPESVSGRSSDGSSNFEEENEIGSEEEFKMASESIAKVEKATAVAMSDLKSIADCMMSSGYGSECINIYKLVRKSIIDEGLYVLGIERFRSSQVQKLNWEVLEHMIKNWLDAVKIAAKTLFNGEKLLCDHVFSESQAIRELCFSAIVTEGARNLLRFPELIAKCKKLPERIFPLMELYEVLSDLWPEIESLFNSESTSAVKLQALSSQLQLRDSVWSTLLDFESAIQKDSSKTAVLGGGIHPLTHRAISYISSLADYNKILSDIFGDSPSTRHTPLPESYFESPGSDDGSSQPVSVYHAWLILILLCKLDSKAGLYKNVSLSYLFLANNLHFIVEKVCTTHLRVMLGQDWVFNHVQKVKQYASSYEMMAWHKVFSSLPGKISPERLSPEAAKEVFQRFNASFEEAHKRQISWVVPNRKLRDDLKVSIAKKLIPTYREFYDTYLVILRGETNLEFVKFGPDDLENCLSDLFHGVSYSGSCSLSSSGECIPR